MKFKAAKILLVIFALLVLIGVLFVKIFPKKEEQYIFSPPSTETVAATEFDEEGSVKIQKTHELAKKIKASVPSEIFGGLYFDDNQNLVVNVTDLNDDSVLRLKNEADSQYVMFRQVKYSLAFLESVRIELTPFMAEYNIAIIDANEVTNKIDIVMYEENKDVENLVSKYIDSKDVTVTVLPDDFEFKLT